MSALAFLYCQLNLNFTIDPGQNLIFLKNSYKTWKEIRTLGIVSGDRSWRSGWWWWRGRWRVTQPSVRSAAEGTDDTGGDRDSRHAARRWRRPAAGWNSRTWGLTRWGWWWRRPLRCEPTNMTKEDVVKDEVWRTQNTHTWPKLSMSISLAFGIKGMAGWG